MPSSKPQISHRDLRDRLGEVLREVEAGAELRVTVRGRPVADLVPVAYRPRPRFVPRADVERLLNEHRPDGDFAKELDAALDPTADERWPPRSS
jgi:prevent-host-death family protein